MLSLAFRDKPTPDQIETAFVRIQMQLLKQYLKPSLREQAWRIFQQVGRRPKPQQLWRAIQQRCKTPHKQQISWIGDKNTRSTLILRSERFCGPVFH